MAPRLAAVRLPCRLCLHLKRKNPAEPEFEARPFRAEAATALRRRKFIEYQRREGEAFFPRMLPTRSHSGILTPAMLSRGPKGYLRPSQRGRAEQEDPAAPPGHTK